MSGLEVTQRQKVLRRFIAAWDFTPTEEDELKLIRGDILLVADEFDDGWMRGIRLIDLEIGFFPGCLVVEDTSPIHKLNDIKPLSREHYISDPKFIDYDSSKRSKIALEIFSSEEAYLNRLKLLNEKFILPLSDNPDVISPQYYGPIFSNIQPLLSLSTSLMAQLKSRMAAWDERFTLMGDIFMHMGHHLKLFVTYAVQHTLGSQMLAKLLGQEKFRSWLEKTEMDLQRTLNSLLLEPIQRVPRYELLLKDLLKHTSEDHPDHNTLKEALNFVQKIAMDCNENIRRAENEFKLFAITKRFPHDDVELVAVKNNIIRDKSNRTENGLTRKRGKRLSMQPRSNKQDSLSARSFFESEHHRVFIKEGMVHKTKSDFSDPCERYLFMCSDVLLISQPNSRNRKSFRLKERVMLVHAWVTDTGGVTSNKGKVPQQGFILGTPRKVYHLTASSVEEKNSWFEELRSHIFTQKRLFNQLLSHLSIPDETYQSVKVKAKVSYLGMLQDELSFKAGDEVSVIGFQNGTGKWRPGLYSQEPFDPSSEWYFGVLNGSSGWFPIQCVMGTENVTRQNLESTSTDELQATPMCVVLALKQRMLELTGREVPPLRDNERVAKIFVGEGNFKTLRITPQCTVDDIVRMYFKVKPDSRLAWSLIEQSSDKTVHRPLDLSEDPSEVIDFWGKSKDQMRFVLKQSIITNGTGESEA